MLTFNSFVLTVSLRYFLAKKNEKFVSIISFISLAGITIGVAALIIVMSVMNGFHIELTNNIAGLKGDIMLLPNGRKTIKNYQTIIKKLETKPYISNITPVISGQALAIGGVNSGVLVKGINLKELKYKGELLNNVLNGSFTDYQGKNHIAVGAELAHQLDLIAGSELKLIAPTLLPTAFGSLPRAKNFKVAAIFHSDLYDYNAATILMPLAAAAQFFSLPDGVNLIELNVDDREQTHSYVKDLYKEFGEELSIRSWFQDNIQLINALEIEKTAMFVILLLIMIVAAFNIIASLFMLVKDKTKDIAILRTIGASRRQIMSVFILNGMLVGIIGTIVGTLTGLLFSRNIENIRKLLEKLSGNKIFDPAIYFLYNLPSIVKLNDIILVASLAILISFLATIYPAYRAASLNPIDSMRYE